MEAIEGSCAMLASRQTLKEINQLNRRVWRKQRESLDRRMADSAIQLTAFFMNPDQMTFSEKTGQRGLLRIGSEVRP
jgi:hypothetical protein